MKTRRFQLEGGQQEGVDFGSGPRITGKEGEWEWSVEDIGEGSKSYGGSREVEKEDGCHCL